MTSAVHKSGSSLMMTSSIPLYSTIGLSTSQLQSSESMNTGVENILLHSTVFNGNTSAPSGELSYERPFTDVAVIVTAVILLTFLVVGLFGNIVTIIVITTNSKLKNIFMHFIVSLCISDLWSALISWLCLYRRTWGFDNWEPLPAVFCRFYWASDLMTSYVTAMHIFSFALLRYLSIQFPVLFQKVGLTQGKIWIGVIWALGFFFGFIPFFIFFDARHRDRLGDSPDSRWPSCTITMEWYNIYMVYQTVGYSIFLYAPSIGIVLVSILISVTVYTRGANMGRGKRSKKQRRKEHQAVLQLVLIVFSFLVGYIPFTAYEFWSVQPRPSTQYYKVFDYWFGVVQYCFLRFSECLNPLFYNLGSSKMRGYTIRFLQKYFCVCCPQYVYKPNQSSSDNTTTMNATMQKTVMESQVNTLA